jgi:arylsulfatase A-like enzyme
VGRVLKYLDDEGLADNTIVIYSSDQGFYLGEHGWFDKRWIFEESLRARRCSSAGQA